MPLQRVRRVVLRATVRTIQWCRFGTPAPRFTISVDADNFIVNFYNDLENVTKLIEFLETDSLDEPTEMARLSPRHHAECVSRVLEAEKRQKTCQTTVLDTSAILDIVGPLLQIRCHRGTSTSRTSCALT